jgi:hypothetical protein
MKSISPVVNPPQVSLDKVKHLRHDKKWGIRTIVQSGDHQTCQAALKHYNQPHWILLPCKLRPQWCDSRTFCRGYYECTGSKRKVKAYTGSSLHSSRTFCATSSACKSPVLVGRSNIFLNTKSRYCSSSAKHSSDTIEDITL